MKNQYLYSLELVWTGEESKDDLRNDRLYEIQIEGKELLKGSADPSFYGDPALYNPEELLLAALVSCHMMSYLYVCRNNGVRVLSYKDAPKGVLKVNQDGSGQFEKVSLNPVVKIADLTKIDLAKSLHQSASRLCFIANSCNFPIDCLPVII